MSARPGTSDIDEHLRAYHHRRPGRRLHPAESEQTIPASGLTMFAKTGYILNLEEPALFNETLARFRVLAEAGRWPPRDPRSKRG
jgi:hypothetical protein